MFKLVRIELRSGKHQDKRMKIMMIITIMMLLGLMLVMVVEFQMTGIYGLITALCLGCCLVNAFTWFL